MGLINTIKRNLEKYKVYRTIKNVNDYVLNEMEYCEVFPLVLGMIGWPIFAAYCFSKGFISFGILAIFLIITYWLHLLLFDD